MTTSLNKTILIIGAGDAQLGGIRKARKMGCRVIAVDGNPYAPGLAEADLGKALDIMDFTKIIELAREQHIDAAMAIASEICLPTVARVNAGVVVLHLVVIPGNQPGACCVHVL